jgi:hypothetical protein
MYIRTLVRSACLQGADGVQMHTHTCDSSTCMAAAALSHDRHLFTRHTCCHDLCITACSTTA